MTDAVFDFRTIPPPPSGGGTATSNTIGYRNFSNPPDAKPALKKYKNSYILKDTQNNVVLHRLITEYGNDSSETTYIFDGDTNSTLHINFKSGSHKYTYPK